VLAPATPMASRMAVGLWAGKLSRMTASLGTSVWGLDISEEGGAVHGPVDGHGRHHAIKCQASNNARLSVRGHSFRQSWLMYRFHR